MTVDIGLDEDPAMDMRSGQMEDELRRSSQCSREDNRLGRGGGAARGGLEPFLPASRHREDEPRASVLFPEGPGEGVFELLLPLPIHF